MSSPSLIWRCLAFKPLPADDFPSEHSEEESLSTAKNSSQEQNVEESSLQTGQKGSRCEAREKPTSAGVLQQYVGARRSSVTKQMGLFQRSEERLNLRLIVVIPATWILISLSVGLIAMSLTQFILGVPTPGSKEVLVLRLTVVGSSLLAGLLGALLAYGITKPVRKVIAEAQKMMRYTETDLPPLKAENEVGALSTLFDQAFVSFVELVQAREILDNLHEGIVALDEKGRIAGMNLQAQRLLGICLAQGQQKSFRDLLSGSSSHNHILYDFVQSALRERAERSHNRLVVQSLSGEEHLLSAKVTPLQVKRDPQAFVGVILTLKEYPAGLEDVPEIIGKSEQLTEVLNLAAKVAPTDSTVLLTGESGTGKELLANAIHHLSKRKEGPFVNLNCAAIPEALLESELFGHERGAFTGAVSKKPGMFDLADGGTIFLDEIGDISLSTQVKLLRVLQEKEFTAVGGEERKRADVRVIAATNSELLSEVQRGKFREDLYYRLNGITIGMPPLRERKSDIPLLADHFLEEMAKQTHAPKKSLSRSALEYLLSCAWPGNVRELRNSIERAWLLSGGPIIRAEEFASSLSSPPPNGDAQVVGEELFDNKISLNETIEAVEKELIIQALKKSGWIQVQAAKLLGVNHKNLWHKIRKHKIARENLNV